jgi:hypothetical protein
MPDSSDEAEVPKRGLLSGLSELFIPPKSWSWTWKYNPNLFEHMHALGVIAANYNELEGQFYRLFWITSDRFEVAKLVFSKLNNAERMEVALKVAENEPKQFKEHYRAFIGGFGTSHENRNVLMHSRAHNAWPRNDTTLSRLTLAKPSKKAPDENNFISLEVAELRDVADDMAAYADFGWELYFWRLAFFTGGKITWPDGETVSPTLPEIPAPPRKLALSPQPTQVGTPPQIEASGG